MEKLILNTAGNYVQDFEASPGYELDELIQPDVTITEIEPALERWQCAKECIDKLGDDGCLAFDVCEELTGVTLDEDASLASLSDLIRQGDSTVRCRISSSYIGVVSNTTSVKKVKDNENCTLYTRKSTGRTTFHLTTSASYLFQGLCTWMERR